MDNQCARDRIKALQGLIDTVEERWDARAREIMKETEKLINKHEKLRKEREEGDKAK
jgi:hypothetical protein